MKRIVILGLVLTTLLGTVPLFAEEHLNLEAVTTVNLLIDRGLEKNKLAIASLSEQLNMSQKMYLYDRHEAEVGVPFAVNFLVGAGIGSFIQGDVEGGVTALVGELLSWGCLGTGYVMMAMDICNSAEGDYYSDGYYWEDATIDPLSAGLLIGGAIGLCVFRIYELVRPFSYAKEHNDTLRDSLGFYGY